ncbi:MAG: hypothetical protein U1E13_04205, partial [Methylophilaceae bacterium]|nr:hypothetical protein [Methylophilaceae bacterium]
FLITLAVLASANINVTLHCNNTAGAGVIKTATFRADVQIYLLTSAAMTFTVTATRPRFHF